VTGRTRSLLPEWRVRPVSFSLLRQGGRLILSNSPERGFDNQFTHPLYSTQAVSDGSRPS